MKRWAGLLAVPLLVLLAIPAADLYYKSSWGKGCARCHEIRPQLDSWEHSAHRKINCVECHRSSLTTNVRRVASHLLGDVPDQPKLRHSDVLAMVDQCRGCHRQEFAQWQAGPHAATFERIFTDKEHNRKRRLMDDCLRCHGMHFEGAIGDLVTPVSTGGPWRLLKPELVKSPAIPCLACHAMHRDGAPLLKDSPPEKFRPSLALYDRRSQSAIATRDLPIPMPTSPPDQRQALCYQCHAPLASGQIASGDDRTPKGVHAGLSCLACHQKHSQSARASCATCHPRLSNCGLDVEKMDTTFLNVKSKHNVHWVACNDCHPKGIPPRPKPAPLARASN
ncbi:MAG: hypothetical protein IT168_23770 [Bryobacterales bacterium]|nr:hypothetical protein [Bryobacterales bacterium]